MLDYLARSPSGPSAAASTLSTVPTASLAEFVDKTSSLHDVLGGRWLSGGLQQLTGFPLAALRLLLIHTALRTGVMFPWAQRTPTGVRQVVVDLEASGLASLLLPQSIWHATRSLLLPPPVPRTAAPAPHSSGAKRERIEHDMPDRRGKRRRSGNGKQTPHTQARHQAPVPGDRGGTIPATAAGRRRSDSSTPSI